MPVRIGNGCGFWGDNLDAPILLAEQGALHYLTLEYLAELPMSILLAAGHPFANLDTGAPLATLRDRVVSANAYLGAAPIVTALERGARIVITGRVADASLTLAPAVHELSWSWSDLDKLCAGTVAG